MINSVVLVGRLTKDIDLRKTSSNISTCTFTLACDKKFKPTQEGAPTADFINCVAWRQSADFLASYASKGQIVGVEGSIQTRNYDGQDGRKVYVTEVVCDRVRLIGSRPANSTGNYQSNNNYQANTNQTFTPVQDQNNYNDSLDDDFSNTPSLDISSDDLPFY